MPIGQPPIAFGLGDFLLCRRPGPTSYVEDEIRLHTFRELEGRCCLLYTSRQDKLLQMDNHLAC